MSLPELLFVEKYRPKTIDECILPQRLKTIFKEQVANQTLQNMILSGTAGVGKTTLARALCHELDIDYLFVNASEDRTIDGIRTNVRSFVSMMSVDSVRCVIFDEADGFSYTVQPALKGFIEEFAKTARFILTVNHLGKIIEPIQSRCTVVDFTILKSERNECLKLFNRRVRDILEKEDIEYDKKDLVEIILANFPDYRKTLNIIQRCSLTKKLVFSGTSLEMGDDAVKVLVDHIRKRDYGSLRRWVAENTEVEFNQIVRRLYDTSKEFVKPESIPELILILNEYDYKHGFCVDKEINTMAMLTQIFADIQFK